MRTDQLALSRSATDRDAERRSEPGLLERLAADPDTRLLLVDARGRVALTGPAIHTDLPDDGLTPPSLIGSPGATAWEGPGTRSGWALPDLRVGYLGAAAPSCCPDLTVLYMGRELTDDAASTGPSWIAVVVPQALEVPDAPEPPATGSDAEGTAIDHPDLRRTHRDHRGRLGPPVLRLRHRPLPTHRPGRHHDGHRHLRPPPPRARSHLGSPALLGRGRLRRGRRVR